MPRYYLPVMLTCWTLLLAGCTGTATGSGAVDARSVGFDGQMLDGRALYARYCAQCHRPLEKTTKPQRTASRLRSANRQYPAMASLDVLTDDQLEAIAAALKNIPLAN